MTSVTLPTPTPPGPGEPRPCKGCKAPYIPGVAGGFGEHCRRCNNFIKKRKPIPGQRVRQPRGKAKQRLRPFVHPDMLAALTPELLAAYRVKTQAEFLVLAAARLLGRPEWEPKKTTPKSEPSP